MESKSLKEGDVMSLSKKELDSLKRAANQARKLAYAPYSKHRLGAALLTREGEIIAAGNIENSCYALTVCAERAVLYRAVSQGTVHFKALLVHSDGKELISPCGACRQVLWELAGNIEIIMVGTGPHKKRMRLSALYPHPYKRKNRHRLKKNV